MIHHAVAVACVVCALLQTASAVVKPPGAPGTPTITEVKANSLKVSWIEPSSFPGDEAIVKYNVFVNNGVEDGPGIEVEELQDKDGPPWNVVTSLVVDETNVAPTAQQPGGGLVANTAYLFRVQACRLEKWGGCGAKSAYSTSVKTLPPKVTGLFAKFETDSLLDPLHVPALVGTKEEKHAQSREWDSTHVTIGWDKVQNGDVTYRVYVRDKTLHDIAFGKGEESPIPQQVLLKPEDCPDLPATVTNCLWTVGSTADPTMPVLKPNTLYQFSVAALNSQDSEGEMSAWGPVKTQPGDVGHPRLSDGIATVPAAPKIESVLPVSHKEIEIKWAVPEGTASVKGHRYYRSVPVDQAVGPIEWVPDAANDVTLTGQLMDGGAKLSLTVNQLACNENYKFQVVTENIRGMGAPSIIQESKTTGNPVWAAGTPDNNQKKFAWIGKDLQIGKFKAESDPEDENYPIFFKWNDGIAPAQQDGTPIGVKGIGGQAAIDDGTFQMNLQIGQRDPDVVEGKSVAYVDLTWTAKANHADAANPAKSLYDICLIGVDGCDLETPKRCSTVRVVVPKPRITQPENKKSFTGTMGCPVKINFMAQDLTELSGDADEDLALQEHDPAFLLDPTNKDQQMLQVADENGYKVEIIPTGYQAISAYVSDPQGLVHAKCADTVDGNGVEVLGDPALCLPPGAKLPGVSHLDEHGNPYAANPLKAMFEWVPRVGQDGFTFKLGFVVRNVRSLLTKNGKTYYEPTHTYGGIFGTTSHHMGLLANGQPLGDLASEYYITISIEKCKYCFDSASRTIFDVAKEMKTNWQTIWSGNHNIQSPDNIVVAQCTPGEKGGPCEEEPFKSDATLCQKKCELTISLGVSYTAVAGDDSLGLIAKQFGVTVQDLLYWNGDLASHGGLCSQNGDGTTTCTNYALKDNQEVCVIPETCMYAVHIGSWYGTSGFSTAAQKTW